MTFTATVTASSTPAGSVTFFDGTTALATSALNASGVAIYSTSNLSVGGHSITAAYQGNSTFAASTSGTASVTVTAPALTPTTTTLSTSATSITTGQSVTFTATITASSTPSGTVTFYDGMTALGTGTLNGSGVTTYQTSGLSIGPHSITAAYQGNSTFAASTSSAITVTVTTPVLTVTTTKLTATATTVSVGTSVTFNVTVSPASGAGTPTGTITFMDGTTTLAMMSLSSGAASYSTGSLAVGAHPITAVYGGDANYAGSTSSAVTVTVQALVPSFTIGALPQSGTVVAGATAQTSITVTPVNGFNQQVSFACSGVSNGVTCGFNPSTVTPSGSAASTTMSLATTTQSAVLAPLGQPASRPGLRGAATLRVSGSGSLVVLPTREESSLAVHHAGGRWPGDIRCHSGRMYGLGIVDFVATAAVGYLYDHRDRNRGIRNANSFIFPHGHELGGRLAPSENAAASCGFLGRRQASVSSQARS